MGTHKKPQDGIWVLTAPDGRKFAAESPLGCCKREMESRVPREVLAKRVLDSRFGQDESE